MSFLGDWDAWLPGITHSFQVLGCENWKCIPLLSCFIKHRNEEALSPVVCPKTCPGSLSLSVKCGWWQNCVVEHHLSIRQRAWQQASNSDFHSGPANKVTVAPAREDERLCIWACASQDRDCLQMNSSPFFSMPVRLLRWLPMLNSDTGTRTKWFEITWLSSGRVTNTSFRHLLIVLLWAFRSFSTLDWDFCLENEVEFCSWPCVVWIHEAICQALGMPTNIHAS